MAVEFYRVYLERTETNFVDVPAEEADSASDARKLTFKRLAEAGEDWYPTDVRAKHDDCAYLVKTTESC
jgi:hypothetical protein